MRGRLVFFPLDQRGSAAEEDEFLLDGGAGCQGAGQQNQEKHAKQHESKIRAAAGSSSTFRWMKA